MPSFCGYRVVYIAFVFHIPVGFQIPVHDVIQIRLAPLPPDDTLTLADDTAKVAPYKLTRRYSSLIIYTTLFFLGFITRYFSIASI